MECTSIQAAGSSTQPTACLHARQASSQRMQREDTARTSAQSSGIGRLAGPAAITRSTGSTSLRVGCSAQAAFRGGTLSLRSPGAAWVACSLPLQPTRRWQESVPTTRPLGVTGCRSGGNASATFSILLGWTSGISAKQTTHAGRVGPVGTTSTCCHSDAQALLWPERHASQQQLDVHNSLRAGTHDWHSWGARNLELAALPTMRLAEPAQTAEQPGAKRQPRQQYTDEEWDAWFTGKQCRDWSWGQSAATWERDEEPYPAATWTTGDREADEVANLGTAAHALHEPTAEYLRWELVAQAVRVIWLLVAPKLRDRPESWLHARLPAPAEDAETPQIFLALRPLVWLGHIDVLSCSTLLPDAWTASQQRDAVEDEVPGLHPEAEPQGLHPVAEPQGIG
eukprot:2994151-Amphidinium_carterae.2